MTTMQYLAETKPGRAIRKTKMIKEIEGAPRSIVIPALMSIIAFVVIVTLLITQSVTAARYSSSNNDYLKRLEKETNHAKKSASEAAEQTRLIRAELEKQHRLLERIEIQTRK